MTPVITLNRPMRITIEDLPQWIAREHTATPMLVFFCRRALGGVCQFDREALINVMATAAPHKAAAFEYNLMRINDSLPLAGWTIRTIGNRYFLCALNDMEFGRVVEWHRRRYG